MPSARTPPSSSASSSSRALSLSPQGSGQGEERWPTPPPRRMSPGERTRRQWALLGLLAMLWGGAFFFSKVALGELPPFTVVLVRFGVAAAALLAGGRRARPRRG